MADMDLTATRRLLTAVLGVSITIAAAGAAAPTAHAITIRDSIVAVAQREHDATSRNYEANPDGSAGSTNCTFYAGQMTGWPSCGPSGWGWRGGSSPNDGTYAWCSVFAWYVWREAGVSDLSGLGTFAKDFKTYGVNHGTWHPAHNGYVPQPGDAIVFDWEQDGVIDHVGLVISNSSGTLTTIEGNWGDRVSQNTRQESSSSTVGFASPVGADTVTNVPTDPGADDPARAPSIKADFNADGKEDIALFNDMGNGGLRLFVHYGGQSSVQQIWNAPTWGYTISSVRFASGHFGYSAGSDIAAFLDYGGGRLGVWVFQGSSLASPFLAIDASTWGYSIANSRRVTGDYNNDGYTDIAVFTDMGSGHLREHVIYGGQWNLGFQQLWDAASWSYPISSMRFASGHFGYSGGSDIAGFLDYGNGDLGVWVWQGNNLGSPFRPINAPTWGYPITGSRFTTGDYNNDGYTDIAVFVDLGGGGLRLHVIYGGQWNLGFQQKWNAPTWGYPITSVRFVSGHFGYSGGSDIAGFLDYGNGDLGVWVWQGNSLGSPFRPINAPTWTSPIVSSRFTTGDYNNDGYSDIAIFTDMDNGGLRQHRIYGGQWNLGLQLVWDAPTWGYPIGNLRLIP